MYGMKHDTLAEYEVSSEKKFTVHIAWVFYSQL